MGQNGPSAVVTIAKGDGSRVVEQRRFVSRDRQSFQAIWSAHAGHDIPAPAVDFSTHMVAAVFAGARPNPGYEVEITGTRREGSTLLIVDQERVPPADRVAAQIVVSPFHIVAVPRDDGEIRFARPDGALETSIVFKLPKTAAQLASTDHASAIADGVDGIDGEATTTMLPRPTVRASSQSDVSSSTGLTPRMAASMAYLAGPFSGALLLATERSNGFVRFHAWQAVLALGTLGVAAVMCLVLAFAFLIVSPTAFWIMLWLSAATGVAWLIVWGVCLFQAYNGRLWKLPWFGEYAERRATSLLSASAR